MLDIDLSFVWLRFFLVLFFTIVSFAWLRRRKSSMEKFYFLFILFLIFIYSGVGAGWEKTPYDYSYIYVIYIMVFGIVCYATTKHNKRNQKQSTIEIVRYNKVDGFINKYGRLFVILYVIIPFISLILEGKILNLISPPSLNLSEAIEGRFDSGTSNGGLISSILYYIQNLDLPFYLLSLYKYRNDIFKLSLALLLPLYFSFAEGGYIARSTLMPMIVILYFAFYIKYPQYRKKLVVGTIILLPALLFFLSLYTFIRIGADFNLSFGDAISLLAYQETCYPVHYEEMQKWSIDWKLLYTYIEWLITLPFPGFLKDSGLDYSFTAYFSEKITGANRTDANFNILLPGLVGESIFIFGKTFYWVHAMIVGFVVGNAYKIVHHKQELFLVLYMSVFGGLCFARAGSVSMMPFYFKHLIIYVIVIYFVTHSRNNKIVNVNNSRQPDERKC